MKPYVILPPLTIFALVFAMVFAGAAIGCSAGDATTLPDPNHSRGTTPFVDGGAGGPDGSPPPEGGVPDVSTTPIDVGTFE